MTFKVRRHFLNCVFTEQNNNNYITAKYLLQKEIAEPLMDLKQGIELLKLNKTFKVILSTLRSVGSFLNGSQVKGFRLEYLSKVMEVKDTVHKHPLLYHICEMIIEKFPDTTDFFSEARISLKFIYNKYLINWILNLATIFG